MSAAATYRKLVDGELTMCHAPGCANTFEPRNGRSIKRYCGEKDCPRRRQVFLRHHRTALNDLRAEMRAISEPPVAAVQSSVSELSGALKSADVSDDDLRVTCVRLGAAAALCAATVEALGRRGLSSRGRGASSSRGRGSPPQDASPAELSEAGRRVAEAALGAAG